ncbi:hypothetical protein [Tunturiibacter gelidiferens]
MRKLMVGFELLGSPQRDISPERPRRCWGKPGARVPR